MSKKEYQNKCQQKKVQTKGQKWQQKNHVGRKEIEQKYIMHIRIVQEKEEQMRIIIE